MQVNNGEGSALMKNPKLAGEIVERVSRPSLPIVKMVVMATSAEFTLVEVGHMGATSLTPCAQLQAGEVGYLTASIKTVQDTRVGDTVTLAERPTAEALPGYRQVKPMVFCGIYPADGATAVAVAADAPGCDDRFSLLPEGSEPAP